jgi:hypothetical protein
MSNCSKRRRQGEEIERPSKALPSLQILSIDTEELCQSLRNDEHACERVKAHLEACQRSVLQVFLDHQMAKNAATFPVEIVRRVAASGFLKPLELSRFLLRTTRSFRKGLEEDELYKYLCHARWKASSELPPSLAQAKGYKWQYSKLSSSYQRANFNEGQTLVQATDTLQGEKLAGLVSVLSNNKEVVTYCLETEDFECPCDLSDMMAEEILGYQTSWYGQVRELGQLTASLHLFRLDSMSHCCVVEWDLRHSIRRYQRSRWVYLSRGENSESSYFHAHNEGLLGLQIRLTAYSVENPNQIGTIDEILLELQLYPFMEALLTNRAIPSADSTCFAEILSRMRIVWGN